MEAAPIDTSESEHQQEKDKEREQNRNFWIAVLQGTFMRISFAFADSTTVLPAFILKLTSSNTLVGLTGSMTRAGWMWPQLLISNLLEHRPRKMPFYALGMSFRLLAWIAMVVCTLMVGSGNNGLLAACFLCSAVTSSDLRRWESQRFHIWILSPNPLNRSGGLDISACAS